MNKTYNKLVRDKIPEIIEANGDFCKTRIISHKEEYAEALDKKLNEEVAEYQENKSMEELADILEVMMAIVKDKGYEWKDVVEMQEKKREERGGFEKRFFLETTWGEKK